MIVLSYKILNKRGVCSRPGPCSECPGFNECDKELIDLFRKIKEIRAKGLGYYPWENNYQGPYGPDLRCD